MIEKFNFLLFSDLQREGNKELMLLSIISQSFFQPFSLEDNLLVILTALTSGSGAGFNRAMLLLKEGGRLRGEIWLGPRSPEEAAQIWEVLSMPGIGYVEIIEHNRALVRKNENTLSQRIRNLSYDLDAENPLIPALPVLTREITMVRNARQEPLVDGRFLDLIGVDDFLCIPLLAGNDIQGEIIVDNAITKAPIEPRDIKLASVCGLIAANNIYATTLHKRFVDIEKTAAMGEVAMFVTHQIRNPLVTIGGFTDQLLNGETDEDKRRRNLRIIRDEIKRLEAIIFEMGRFLKTSLKEPVYFDILPVLEAVLQSPDISLKRRGYDLIVKIEPCPPPVLCDPMSFGEVVRNLLDNAFDATPSGGKIALRVYRRSRDWLAVSVRDTGTGISAEDRGRLFSPFFTTKEKGMGLGLAFIKRVMDACGGKIEVRSRPEKGTLFKLLFQCQERGTPP